mmetsp:Transcript_18766/g.43858  ORF Transcript_18766/g.43858 Transcript_18766/m.43858 type:complete len:242 (+) Transcript_18766:809-1534(+)
MTKVVDLANHSIIRETSGVSRPHTLVQVQRDDCPVTISWAQPESPIVLTLACIIELPPSICPAVCLPILVVCAKDHTSFVPAWSRPIFIDHVGTLPCTCGERAVRTIVFASVGVEGVARNPIVVVEAIRIQRVLKMQIFLRVYALLAICVAPSQITNANVTRSIEVSEGDARKNGLHVSVVELESCGGTRQGCGAVSRVGRDDGLVHHRLSKLVRALCYVMRFEVLKKEAQFASVSPEECT